MRTVRRTAERHAARFLTLALVALALAGCSKCDVPVWRHDTAAPASCHDDAPAQ